MGSRVLRTLADLKKECQKNGLLFPKVSDSWKKEDFENVLRDYYWVRDHGTEPIPPQVEVMLANKLNDLDEEEQEEIWNSPNYTAEEKLDGCRIIMQVSDDGSLRFFGRNKSVKTFLYDEKTDVLPFHTMITLPMFANSIFDGELVSTNTCVNTGRTEINNALSACSAIINSEPAVAREFQSKYGPFKYIIFDVLMLGNTATHSLPLEARRVVRRTVSNHLTAFFKELFGEVKYTDVNKKAFYKKIVSSGGEGIMLKDLKAPYEYGKRRWSLLKVKRYDDYDAFISGFVKSDPKAGFKDYIGALEFSVIDEHGKAVVIGNVSAMPLEFRKWATINPGSECTLNTDLLGKVAVIRGQEFSSKNYHLKHCVFSSGFWDTERKEWVEYFRKDKRAEDCIVDFSIIKKKVQLGQRV